MSRLSQLAISQRSVTILLAFALFVAGISAWGSLKQELLPDIDFPVITVVAPYPGRRRNRRRRTGGQADRDCHPGRPAARLACARRRPTRSPSSSPSSRSAPTSRRRRRRSTRTSPASACRQSVTPTVTALNINSSPVVIASIAATSEDGLEKRRADRHRRDRPEIQSIDGVATCRPDRHPRAAGHGHPRSGQARRIRASASSRSSACCRPTTSPSRPASSRPTARASRSRPRAS